MQGTYQGVNEGEVVVGAIGAGLPIFREVMDCDLGGCKDLPNLGAWGPSFDA